MQKSNYLQNLINSGEGQKLDFKYNISDAMKIARSLSAFSNSSGGILLIGVRDNGSIAGIRSDEELFMIEKAAVEFTRPEVRFSLKEWHIEGKTILEVKITEAQKKPVLAPDEKMKWQAFIRYNDKNLIADPVLIQVWKRKQRNSGTLLVFSENEKKVLNLLSETYELNKNEIEEKTGIKIKDLEKILVNLCSMNLVKISLSESAVLFTLNITDTQQ